MSRKVVLALSGGLDSAVLLAQCNALMPAWEVLAVSFDYGSKHNAYEADARKQICAYYNTRRMNKRQPQIVHRTIDLTEAMKTFNSTLLLGQDDVPEGHYAEETMRQTVVPARNIIFCSFMAGLAVSESAQTILLGVHAGDHYIYPDCRPAFICTMEEAIRLGTDTKTELNAPLQHKDKRGIVALGISLGVPFSLTRTCYKAQPIACGKCGSCQERLEAFKLNNLEDPIEYESRELMPKTAVAGTDPLKKSVCFEDDTEDFDSSGLADDIPD